MDVKGNNKREEISNAARELFTRYGYKSVSMEQIATKANVAKGTLYLYYEDKEDLFFQLVKQLFDGLMHLAGEIESKHLSLFQEIHEFVYTMLTYRNSQKFLYTIVNEARDLKTPSTCRAIEMFNDVIMRYVKKKLENGMSEGVIKPCNSSIFAFIVIKVYTALAFEWEETHEPLDEKQIAESISLFIKDGLSEKDRQG